MSLTPPVEFADHMLTLRDADDARCDTLRKSHPVIGGRTLECGECWRVRVARQVAARDRAVHADEAAHIARLLASLPSVPDAALRVVEARLRDLTEGATTCD